MAQTHILESPIEYLSGVGPVKGDMLRKEMAIHTFRDLLWHIPYRYIDKTKFHKINEISEESDTVQLRGILRRMELMGEGRKKRMVGTFRDETGVIELIWFQSLYWLEKNLEVGKEYVVFGKVSFFGSKPNIAHPEIELVSDNAIEQATVFDPVYPSTEKLNAKGLDAKGQRRIIRILLDKLSPQDIAETLPDYILEQFKFPSLFQALRQIHFPRTQQELDIARHRLKFEELFFLQLKLLQLKHKRRESIKGHTFGTIGEHFNNFYNNRLPFQLTEAQKRVIREIRKDMGSGFQMNRLLQGDVGSGKTIVGLMCMIMALDNGFQSCLMAPTEILAQQHFISISEYVKDMGINVAFLSGSIKGKKREAIIKQLADGDIHFIIGTHALIEDWVVFKNLGLTIIDEQHRFGVEQRARLWKKSHPYPPHILVMTATPIPRTLAMTLYGDLDVSVIDELPPGRKEILTVHRTENHRMRVIGFMREEIAKGRQIYVVYPLIEESETLDLLNLQQGYEALCREFPMPEYQISIVHGKMKAADKEFEMQRFIKKETQIMIATTVIEVGVNVPNASVMVIENTERFGLSQLHQLRGRVGRGAEQSFCILNSSFKLSADSRERIRIMCSTNNGFEIAEADLRLRGPGSIEGTQQSGILNLHIADLGKDQRILQAAREFALKILDTDPNLEQGQHQRLAHYLSTQAKQQKVWSRIS